MVIEPLPIFTTFKEKFIKVQKSDHSPDLLEGFPVYWSPHLQCQASLSLEDLESSELSDYKKLDELGILFETPVLLRLEF